jgi:hypothetical protein
MFLIPSYPLALVPAAQAALDKAYAKAVRAAAKEGWEAPKQPTLTLTNERKEYRCRICGTGCPDWHCDGCGAVVPRCAFVDLAIDTDPAVVQGWEFVAVLEPTEAGTLIKRVPGSTEVSLDAYRDAKSASFCDHCQTARKRNETFVVRNIETGEVKRVGRQCVSAFLGGQSIATVLARLAWPKVIMAGDSEEGGWGSSEPDMCDVADVVAWAMSVVRCDGYRKRDPNNPQASSTGGDVYKLMFPHPRDWSDSRRAFGGRGDQTYREWRTQRNPTPEDRARAEEAVAWGRDVNPNNDYFSNVKTICALPYVLRKNLGITVSIAGAYARHLGDLARQQVRADNSAWYGTVDEKIVGLEMVVSGVFSSNGMYGLTVFHIMKSVDGFTFKWGASGKAAAQAGDRVRVTGKIKAHGEFKGEKQTVLTRCKLEKIS